MDYYSVWVGVGLGTTLLDSIQVKSIVILLDLVFGTIILFKLFIIGYQKSPH